MSSAFPKSKQAVSYLAGVRGGMTFAKVKVATLGRCATRDRATLGGGASGWANDRLSVDFRKA
jgi:hypothetical protein